MNWNNHFVTVMIYTVQNSFECFEIKTRFKALPNEKYFIFRQCKLK